ncbi:MAG: LysR family transcriptional regulator [Deltaproteobacteria bacterium]|nr:LysR family transcriptional regulator [Deltaproteobacteria bacterium]
MELTPLSQFLAVAEHGSMSAAARALNVSQPTLSLAIKNLEEELSATLFLRDSRGVSLTASGRALRAAAQEVFETLERARTEIGGLESEDVGEFVVGCNEALGAYFLPTFISSFLKEAPGIQVSLWNGSSAAAREAVLDRKVDFGLVVNPDSHPDLVMVELYRDGIEIYVSGSEPEVVNRMQALLRVRAGPLIAATRIPQVRDLMARLRADDALPERLLDCGDLHLVRSLVVAGLGWPSCRGGWPWTARRAASGASTRRSQGFPTPSSSSTGRTCTAPGPPSASRTPWWPTASACAALIPMKTRSCRHRRVYPLRSAGSWRSEQLDRILPDIDRDVRACRMRACIQAGPRG